jgi:hypothetical protein
MPALLLEHAHFIPAKIAGNDDPLLGARQGAGDGKIP